MLVGAVDRVIDQDLAVEDSSGVGGAQVRSGLIPGAVGAGAAVAFPQGLQGPEALRQVLLNDTGPVQAFDHLAVVGEGAASQAFASAHRRLDERPLVIRQSSTTKHATTASNQHRKF